MALIAKTMEAIMEIVFSVSFALSLGILQINARKLMIILLGNGTNPMAMVVET